MIALHATILVASLLGSLHCASMCGPFAAFAMMRDRRRGPWLLQALYHGGRLFAYATLGALAGGFGASLNFGGSLLGIGRVAGVFTGVLLVALGARRVLAILGVRTPQFPGGSTVGRGLARLQASIVHSDPVVRSLGTGLLTALLPCGWLYAFVATAAGTGSAWTGVTVMLVFWLGSVPILAGIGSGVRQVLARTGRWLQIATAVLVIGLGVVSIVGRWNIVVPAAAAAPAGAGAAPEHHACH
jgi:sulfite exporter TauE/SafE